jgi:hypothetical protein
MDWEEEEGSLGLGDILSGQEGGSLGGIRHPRI